MRASIDDPPAGPGQPDFYARARVNAERADMVVVNHALLLNLFLQGGNALPEDQDSFTRRVVCDEAHTLEEAATLALERWIEERGLRRLLRALHDPRRRSGLTASCCRNVGLPADHPALVALAEAVDASGAALDSLADQLHRFVHNQTIVSAEELRRYGVRVRLEAAALSAAGGPALRRAAESMQTQLRILATALGQIVNEIGAAVDAGNVPAGCRPLRSAVGSVPGA